VVDHAMRQDCRGENLKERYSAIKTAISFRMGWAIGLTAAGFANHVKVSLALLARD
jgi:hypothetical protein